MTGCSKEIGSYLKKPFFLQSELHSACFATMSLNLMNFAVCTTTRSFEITGISDAVL